MAEPLPTVRRVWKDDTEQFRGLTSRELYLWLDFVVSVGPGEEALGGGDSRWTLLAAVSIVSYSFDVFRTGRGCLFLLLCWKSGDDTKKVNLSVLVFLMLLTLLLMSSFEGCDEEFFLGVVCCSIF